MKTVYKLKRFLSVLLALAIIFIGFGSNSVFASKGDAAKLNLGKKVYGNEVKFYPNELFEDADMNEIVFYSENQNPITKRDIITVLKPKTESSPHMITKITVSYSFK